MPIDESIWYDDPPQSTYPGCIAYRAAFLQDEFLAELFLRRLREAVMTERRNISRESVLFELADPFDFDMERFRFDYSVGEAREAFFSDIADACVFRRKPDTHFVLIRTPISEQFGH